ncbi:uncharacterized protein LOC113560674 [Rhopalosiphum maidis]|uniref:uncharacterized protein LOC113560674 n=1 Tax=Rhopalosiphum maidis TaxID=43146 RepID=UPI000EFE154B|nr:uncharacterized protein LOC113560674 [Rhopalosiphum maidis]XP_026822498.1 uncharacterized protein LOC113560674 [Rhopalosiphum maidis]
MAWKLLLAVHNLIVLAHCVDWSGKIYQTNAALEKENLMFCYECNTMVNGKSCSNFTDKDEYSRFSTKCTGDRKTCMVKRYSYTTSNESTTSGQQLWSLERNCSGKCEDGCIVIGERIKIYACQACCESPLCNVSNGTDRRSATPSFVVCLAFLFLLLRATVVDQLQLPPSKRPSATSSSISDPVHSSSDTSITTKFNKYFLIFSSSHHLTVCRR